MRIVFFVNSIDTEKAVYTTTRLGMAAHGAGHEVWYVGAEDLTTLPDSTVVARASRVPDRRFRSLEKFLDAVQEAERGTLEMETLDVFMLRNDPADELDRTWAQHVGIDFGQVLADRGVIVLNDPDGLQRAANKMYVQMLPEVVRPRTVITRDLTAVQNFMENEEADIILKPLRGSGGDRVFLVRRDDAANLNQIFDAVARTGYVIAQQYLDAAAEGDIRLFLMNGRPLEVDGCYAAFRRLHTGGDVRHNMSVGGKAEKVQLSEATLAVAEAVRPKLIEDGMFLVGLDIAGDHILEVNVFSPGGLGSCEAIYGVDFATAIIDAMQAKCGMVASYDGTFRNAQIAVL
jgi:glutathione synthase